MGTPTVLFGEFSLVFAKEKTATLPCQLSEGGKISIILHDHKGRIMLQRKFEVDAHQQSLVIKLPKLESGEYHAWINIGDQTFIRNLEVPAKSNGLNNLFKKIGL